MLIREGGVEVAVSEPSTGDSSEVFFNPEQELNRDITIAVLRAYSEREARAETYLDAMTASGIRGIRAAREGWEVTCTDVDPDAVELCRENVSRNELDVSVLGRDVNALLHESYFDVVDIDPFGTPVPFLDAAFQGTRDLLCVTATDTAPLCGAHFNSGVRKYSAVPRNTEYHSEMGVRILLSAIVRTGARYDVAARPVLTHATKHYVRTYLELHRGAQKADEAVDRLGYIYHCQRCLWRSTSEGLIAHPPEQCPHCEAPLLTAGPVWLDEICERSFLDAVAEQVTDELETGDTAVELIEQLSDELAVPTHYDQHRLCKRWSRPANSMADFLGALGDAGYPVSRTQYGGTTFKTTASVAEIREHTRE